MQVGAGWSKGDSTEMEPGSATSVQSLARPLDVEFQRAPGGQTLEQKDKKQLFLQKQKWFVGKNDGLRLRAEECTL